MVNSRGDSSPDWLHEYQVPVAAAVNISSSSTSDLYGAPSWSAEGVEGKKKSQRKGIGRGNESSDDEPVSKFKRLSSSLQDQDGGDASRQKRAPPPSATKGKGSAAKGGLKNGASGGTKKRVRADAGLDSDGDEGDLSKKRTTRGGDNEDSWNSEEDNGRTAKRKKIEGSGRGRGGLGGGRGGGRGAASVGAVLGGEAKKGAITKVGEGKGRGRGATGGGALTGAQKQLGLDKWLSVNPAVDTPLLGKPDAGEVKMEAGLVRNIKTEAGITHDVIVKEEGKSNAPTDVNTDTMKMAVKKERPFAAAKGVAVNLTAVFKDAERMKTAGMKVKEEEMDQKMGNREVDGTFEAMMYADVKIADEGDEEDGAKGADAAEDTKRKGKVKIPSRLPLMFPEKITRLKVLVECDSEAAALDLSGDVGAVGRFSVRDAGVDEEALLLDIKGSVYKGTIMPSTTFFVVNVGPTEAKVDSIMNDFMLLQEETNIFNAETMVEGTLDDIYGGSDSETAVVRKDRDTSMAPEGGKVPKGGKQGAKQKDGDDNDSEMFKFSGGGESEDDEYSPGSKKTKAGGGSGGKGAGRGSRGSAGKGPKKESVRRASAGSGGRGKGARAGAGKGSRAKAKPKGSGKPRGKGRGGGEKGKERGKQRAKETFKGMEDDF